MIMAATDGEATETEEKRPVSERNWFKHWARESLLSDDLDSLTDHEERVWWRLLSSASIEEPRWSAEITPRLATKCKSTPAKLAKALGHMAALGMVTLHSGRVTLVNAARWNEETNNQPPSSTKEAVRARVAKHRQAKQGVTGASNEGVTSGRNVTCNDHKEEEKEKEEEEEKDLARYTRPRPLPLEESFAPKGDVFGSLVLAFGGGITRRLEDEFDQLAEDWPDVDQVNAAIAKCRRQNDRPYPSKIRAALMDLYPQPKQAPVREESFREMGERFAREIAEEERQRAAAARRSGAAG